MAEMKLNREKLLDKLGERWLFEKKTVALYDSIIKKLDTLGVRARIDELKNNRAQEQQHQKMLEEYIRTCGSNTRRKTPSQMLVEMQSKAFENIIASSDDPSHLLHVLLDAELEDNASWELLIRLARSAGQRDFIAKFEEAIEHEREHLRKVRTMVTILARHELVEQANV